MDQRNKDEKSEIEQQTDRSAAAVDSKEEADALHCPPDPKWPSGILSMIVHNIEGLETREVEEGVKGKEREGTAGQDVDAPARRLPSGYCEMIVNDDIIYKTRVKQYTNAPFFEAGTEAFVRDWTKAHARVVVRDARLREHDPIMGIVSMNLKDLFESSSQVTRLFSLQDGVGFGKVNCSFVFKAVKLELPRPLLGWDTATVELLSEVRIEANSPEWESKLNVKKIVASTGDDTQKLAPPGSQRPDTSGGNVDAEALYRLPVYDRFASNLTFEIGGGGGIGPLGGKPDGIAVLALRDLVDDEVSRG